MDQNKKALADRLFRNVQLAHIKGMIEYHHAPTVEQTLENYLSGFRDSSRSANAARCDVRAARFMQAEASAIPSILAECYDADKAKMLAKLEARPDLLGQMPVMTDYLVREGGNGLT